MDAAVLIVGAGPVGLTAAALLQRRGVDCLVLEALAEPAADLRASTFHPPTLEMLEELDVTDRLLAAGLVSPTWQVRMHETGERALFDLAILAADTRYPFRLQCEQRVLCALLERDLDGRVPIRRGQPVVAVAQDDERATVTLADGTGLGARYLVGADGSRSLVRKAVAFSFDGDTYPETTILATTVFPFQKHLEGLSNVNYCWSAHGTFSLLRLPDLWRCSLYADEGESEEQALTPAAIQTKLQRILPRREPYDVGEIRPYRIHQRIVETYRRSRVLLAGDAAHLNSPSGGMGMNGGVHDAFNLADKLARVLDGADERLLDQYDAERRPVAREQILAQAHRNRTRMQQRDPAARRAELARLQGIAADPVACRDFLLKSSMIHGLRQAALAA
jgi:3-(3-hydroxy-phenyl)propionate hydroxylase